MTQQDLLQQLSNHKYAIDQASIVAITDCEGIITYVNDKFCEISGYSRDELIGKTHSIVKSDHHNRDFYEKMWTTIRKGHVWKGEFKNKNKCGLYYWVSTTIVPFRNSQGIIDQYLSIRHEITDLKEAQQTILEQQTRLAVASKYSALGEMAANLTHEINNPLAAILGRCELLLNQLQRNDLEKTTIRKSIESIEFTARRIEKIIKSMRSFSVASDGDPFEIVPVKTLIDETVDFVQQRFKDYNINLILSPMDEKLNLECRSTEISQVLLNLLNNAFDAIKSFESKWVKIEVNLNASTTEQMQSDKNQINLTADSHQSIVITVTDSGSGIPESMVNRIFDPFYSTKEKQYGTGLGLSISKGLIKRHHGQIEVDLKSPHTRFIITLPYRQPSH